MQITKVLTSPFAWLANLLSPKIPQEVEDVIEQLDWMPSSFELSLSRRNPQTGDMMVQIVSVGELWNSPTEEPDSVSICLLPDDCWLEFVDGERLDVTGKARVKLIEAVRRWLVWSQS